MVFGSAHMDIPMMFSNNSKADFSIHKKLTKEERNSIEELKEVCKPGFI